MIFYFLYQYVWYRVVSRAGIFGSGWVRVWVCRNVSSRFRVCIQNFFITTRATIFFFRDVHFLCPPRLLLWVNLSSANSICKHRYVVLFSARISLTLLQRRRQRWGNRARLHCLEEINHSRESWLVWRNDCLQTGLSCLERYTSFFYAYRATVDSFVIISFFLEKYYILQHYRWLSR